MADTKITGLTAIGASLSGDDVLAIIQDPAGTPISRKVTLAELIEYSNAKHFIRADVDRTLPNDTNLNAIFNAPTNGRLTLTTGVYQFEGLFIVTGMSGTSNNALLNVLGAGTATIGSWMWMLSGIDNTTPSTLLDDDSSYFQTNATAAAMVTATTGTALRFSIRGSFECTAGGTLIPSIDQANAAAAVVQDGSYFLCQRLGADGLVSVGDWD